MVTTVKSRAGLAATMQSAAHEFLVSLSEAQRQQALLPFDEVERLDFHFTPRPRRGIPLAALKPHQRALAHALLSTGLSPRGYVQAATIMSLEQVLRDFETERRFVRDSDIYYVSIFAEPSLEQTWGWRFEGHHISINYTLPNGQLASSTPSFLGANPAEVRQGPRSGLRVLAGEEDRGRELLLNLDAERRTDAIIDSVAPPDLLTFNRPLIDPEHPAGLPAASMNERQRDLLSGLIVEYAEAMPPEVAVARLQTARKTEPRDLYFAWAGPSERGAGHYYRIQAPAFLIEYDCTQDSANHIHSVWRDFRGDFGRDLLRLHYQANH